MSFYWTGKWLEAGAVLITKSTRFVLPIAIAVVGFASGPAIRWLAKRARKL